MGSNNDGRMTMRLSSFEQKIMRSPIRKLMMRRIEAPRLFSGVAPGALRRILELGCGSGVGTASILTHLRPQSLVATDFDSDTLLLAQSNCERWLGAEALANVRFDSMDATRMPFSDHEFDAVVAFGVLHHITAYRKAVAEAARVLAPGGVFLLEEVTAHAHPWPIDRLMPPAVMLEKRDIVDALEDNGFTVTDRGGFFGAFLFFEGRLSAGSQPQDASTEAIPCG
jgi:SAM-dependent methyltransferase